MANFITKLRKTVIFETTFAVYTAVSILGEGGSGRIYKCTDESGEKWAVKLLDAKKTTHDKIKRFKNELLFCQRNKHPNIITVVDHGLYREGQSSSPFYVMPVYNENLRTLIRSGIVISKVLPFFAQLLDGVEAAHLQKVIHRDIKPENVLYDSGKSRLLMCDFGIAHFEEEELFTAVETEDTVRLANFQYAAPEQRGRTDNVGHFADIYALGLILNEMFTGEVPYGTGYKTIGSVAPEYGYLDELISSMLRRNPSERPASIAIIKSELIGRKNEFVTQQRISELKDTVVPITDIDDPLIADPPRLISFDYDRGSLILILSRPVHGRWILAFQNMGEYSYIDGYEPHRFSISNDRATIEAREDNVQLIINYFRDWLPLANAKYEQMIRQEKKYEEDEKRKKLRQEIADREQRLRILKSARI
jgi:serine/threonine protein kinase